MPVEIGTPAIHVCSCLTKEGMDMFLRAYLVIAVCDNESFIVKSRIDVNGVVKKLPSFPDTVIAYIPERKTQDQKAVSKILPLIWRSKLHARMSKEISRKSNAS